jgi:hypothetical protein
MVLTVSFVLSPVTGLCCHRRQRECLAFIANLNASVGASRPHDFAVRKPALRLRATLTSTASRLTLVTIAKRPSGRRDGMNMNLIWGDGEAEYFCKGDWTG